MKTVERYNMFEVTCKGPEEGNPFTEQTVRGTLTGVQETITAEGFYDGNGIYKIRFMPSFTGIYHYSIRYSFQEQLQEGDIEVTEAGDGNHGPVHVANQYHFAYADGTPHYSVGTTCYAFAHQREELVDATFRTLERSPFNKIRFCIFPKHYIHNLKDPETFPFEGTPCDRSQVTEETFSYNQVFTDNHFDYDRFNPEHFRRLDRCVERLMALGIEADLIVMHPYDCWGFSTMTKEQDERYWRYVIARYAAYRNVWWSLANEYDLMKAKDLTDWEHYAELLCRYDPYCHLRSVHNCRTPYDYTRPWVTHCSYQRVDVYKTTEIGNELRQKYGKPVVFDEICYEGDIDQGWGNITAQEMVRRFWEAAMRGTYPGHGETYRHPEDILWWSHGGELHGQSPERIAFLRKIMEETPGCGLRQEFVNWDDVSAVPDGCANPTGYQLFYYGFNRPSFRILNLPQDEKYTVEVIDTWNMTVETVGVYSGTCRIPLPSRQYMAIRVQKAEAV